MCSQDPPGASRFKFFNLFNKQSFIKDTVGMVEGYKNLQLTEYRICFSLKTLEN